MTASKEERLQKVAATIMRLAFQETEQAIDMASAGRLWPWCRSMDAAEMVEALYAEEIGRPRRALEEALRMVKQYAPNGIERSARFRDCQAALALSQGLEGEGNGASNASQAAMGPVAHLAPDAAPSAAWEPLPRCAMADMCREAKRCIGPCRHLPQPRKEP